MSRYAGGGIRNEKGDIVFEQDYYVITVGQYFRYNNGHDFREIKGFNRRHHDGNSKWVLNGDSTVSSTGSIKSNHKGNIDKTHTGSFVSTHTGNRKQSYIGNIVQNFKNLSVNLVTGINFGLFTGFRTRISAGVSTIFNLAIQARFTLSEDSFILHRNRFIIVNGETIIFDHNFGYTNKRLVGKEKTALLKKSEVALIHDHLAAQEKLVIEEEAKLKSVEDVTYNIHKSDIDVDKEYATTGFDKSVLTVAEIPTDIE